MTGRGEQKVYLWWVDPEQVGRGANARHRLWQLLDGAERQRWQSFRFERDRLSYLVTRALARAVLSRYGQCAPQRWRFVRDQLGKPEIAPGQNLRRLRFNLSHAPGIVACGVTRAIDVGVDAEDVQRQCDAEAIVRRYFAPEERRDITGRRGAALRRAFFQYWTLKEAYTKARGEGLSRPFDQFAFHLPPSGVPRVEMSAALADRSEDWAFRLFYPTETHVLALAARVGPRRRLAVELRNAHELLASSAVRGAGSSIPFTRPMPREDRSDGVHDRTYL